MCTFKTLFTLTRFFYPLQLVEMNRFSLIAYGWRRFIEENGDDPERLVLMPMVKAAFLAMNATDDILHQEMCGPKLPNRQVS